MRDTPGLYFLIAILIGPIACSRTEQLVYENAAPTTVNQMPGVDGQAAYDEYCASCHRDGVDGAPATGDSSAWSGRSPLWMAVLSEHAMDGYLQMPARGGDASISNAEVQAATEYMLLLAYPDRPAD